MLNRLGRTLGHFMLLALLAWVMPLLVQSCAEAGEEIPGEVPSPLPAILCASAGCVQETAPLPAVQGRSVQRRAVLPMRLEAELDERCAARKDGNGWIITGRSWPKCVYAVCPPEGVPG